MKTSVSICRAMLGALSRVCSVVTGIALAGCVQFGGGLGAERVTSGYAITAERAEFIRTGLTTRAQVLAEFRGKLNPPRWTEPDSRGITYTWTTTNGAVGGVGGAGDPSLRTFWVQQTDHGFCLIFDQNDHVVRTQFFQASDETKLRAKVEQWLAKGPAR